MGLEVANYIAELDENWPLSGDNVSQGDDHLRLIKSVLQSQFPNLGTDVAVTKTAAELNAQGIPPGAIIAYSHFTVSTLPGYFSCDGQEISRIDYAELYAVIGTTWGAGDGSTTYNLPDLRDAIIGGLSPTNPITTQMGKDAWVSADLPNHKHTISGDGAHVHQFETSSYDNTSGSDRVVDKDKDNTDLVPSQSDGEHSHNMSSAFGGASVDNRQKTVYMRYLIKT